MTAPDPRNVRDILAEENEEMLFADGLDEALIGTVVEHFNFNVLGAWMGDNTPAFATLVKKP